MKTRRMVLGSVLCLGLLAGVAIVAQEGPVQNIEASKHPNLAEAQHLISVAFDKISVAQKDNHEDMQGHAEKAKELLVQASHELKEAAEAANRNHH